MTLYGHISATFEPKDYEGTTDDCVVYDVMEDLEKYPGSQVEVTIDTSNSRIVILAGGVSIDYPLSRLRIFTV